MGENGESMAQEVKPSKQFYECDVSPYSFQNFSLSLSNSFKIKFGFQNQGKHFLHYRCRVLENYRDKTFLQYCRKGQIGGLSPKSLEKLPL